MRRRRRCRRSVIRGARLIIRSAGPLRLRAARAARVFACPPGAELLEQAAVLGPHSSACCEQPIERGDTDSGLASGPAPD